MEITVQWIRTSWTKESRGGEAASRRNATPVGFALPPGGTATSAHVIRMQERDGFKPCATQEDPAKVDVRLMEADGRLRVFPRVQPLFGLPPRPRRPPAVRLAPGQWVRWQLNYRFSSALGIRGWSYWLDTFNVAYGPISTEVFLSSPTSFIDERGPLR